MTDFLNTKITLRKRAVVNVDSTGTDSITPKYVARKLADAEPAAMIGRARNTK
jgi:hypothetical protein